jgi:hypothetical protein
MILNRFNMGNKTQVHVSAEPISVRTSVAKFGKFQNRWKILLFYVAYLMNETCLQPFHYYLNKETGLL